MRHPFPFVRFWLLLGVAAASLGLLAMSPAAVADDAPAAADEAAPDRVAFVALLEAHDCKLPLAEAEMILSDAGFTPGTLNPIADAMLADGSLVIGDTEMTLKTGTCQ